MPIYTYRAVTDKGLIVKNRVEASSKNGLINILKSNKLTPIDIEQVAYRGKQKRQKKNVNNLQELMKNINTTNINTIKRKKQTNKEKFNLYFSKFEKVTHRDLVVFTENFYLLKRANFNNIHALSTIIKSTENETFKGILEDILAGVEAGENIYSTMEYYSNVFPYLYINMIKVGELSGSLTNSLDQAVKYLDSSEELNKKLKKILIPNIIQFVGLLALLLVGTIFGVPVVQDVYAQFGSKESLPAITLWFADVVNGLVAYWYIPTIIIVAIVIAIIAYIKTPRGKYNYHYFKYKMPIFGKLIFAIDFSRFMKAMLLNLKNGMRIQDALDVSKNVLHNLVLLSVVETSINNIIIGESWIEPFEKSGLTSAMMTEMLKIGMQTDMTEMMEKLVEYIDIDIDQILEKIMELLPQIVFAIVGIVLIFFVLVVLVPAIQVYMGNWLFSAYGV